MKNEERIIELLTEVLTKQDQMTKMIHALTEEVRTINIRLDRLEKQTAMNSAAIGELRLSVMRLSENEARLQRLEKHAFGE
jgi:chaperonin cofactor prefoldin